MLTAEAAGRGSSEEACERQRAAVAEADGPAQWSRLIGELQIVAEQHQESAPECAGRVREHQARLFVRSEQFARGARVVSDYLAGPGQHTSATSKLALNNRLGYMLSRLGRTLEASHAYFHAATFAHDAPPAYGARALGDAAITAHKLGDFDSADEYIRSALAISDDDLSTDPKLRDELGRNLIAAVFVAGDRLRTAAPAQRPELARSLDSVSVRALDVLDAPTQTGLRSFAINHHALAAAYLGQFDEAKRRLRTSLALATRARLDTPGAVFDSWINRSRILALSGDLAGAEEAGSQALEAATEAASMGDEATALEQLGSLAESSDDLPQAEQLYRSAITRREAGRERLGLQDWSATVFARSQAPYRGLVRVHLAQGRVADALTVLDQTKARYLSDLRRHLAVRTLADDSTRAMVDSVSTLIYERRLRLLRTRDAGERARLTREMSTYQAEIERAVDAPSRPSAPLDLGALRAELETSGRTLVSYFLGDEASTAFVVTADTLLAVELAVGQFEVSQLLSEAGSPWRSSGEVEPAFSLAALHGLYRGLVAPLRLAILTDAVVIVADGETGVVPFAALPVRPSQGYEDASYLVREWSIGTELAASFVYAEPASTPEPQLDILALGQGAAPGSTWNTSASATPFLAHARAEVDHLGTFWGSRVKRGEHATEREYRTHAPRARVVHVASHAVVQAELPMYSSIQLAPGDGEDGALHLYELINQPLIADLVVLSGCSTAGGDRRRGEGILSLQYAVRAAGAAGSVATLWAVDDQATQRLVSEFYGQLGAGARKDHALRNAQLAYIASHDGLAASPFYWAAPVLSGTPAPLPLQQKPHWGTALAALVAAAGLAWWLRRTRAHDQPTRSL